MALIGKVEPGGDIRQRMSPSDRLARSVQAAHDLIAMRGETMLLHKGSAEMLARDPRRACQRLYCEWTIFAPGALRARPL